MTDQPTAGRFEGRAHLLPLRVYYEDTDFTGVVYHANYVRYFERGRSDFLRLTGSGHATLLEHDEPMAFVVAELALKFLKPARIDDALLVRTTYNAIKGPRLLISQAIERDGELVDDGAHEAELQLVQRVQALDLERAEDGVPLDHQRQHHEALRDHLRGRLLQKAGGAGEDAHDGGRCPRSAGARSPGPRAADRRRGLRRATASSAPPRGPAGAGSSWRAGSPWRRGGGCPRASAPRSRSG